MGEMKHSFTRALTARKVDFMMIITGEGSKSGWRRASFARPRQLVLWLGQRVLPVHAHASV